MPLVDVNAVRILYELSGPDKGPVLAFSNSLGADLSMWNPQAQLLRQHFRILRYDMRGQGQSSVIPGESTIETFGRDFLVLLGVLGIDHVTFCGLSMGGMIGMWLGVNAHQRLRALVLCNTASRIGTEDSWNTRIQAVRHGGMKAVSAAVIERWFTPEFRAASPELVDRARQMLEASPVQGYAACCSAIRDMDQTGCLNQIRVPTLVISGMKDAVTSPQEGRFLAEHIAGSQYVELSAAHLSNVEQAAEFTAALCSFAIGRGQSHG